MHSVICLTGPSQPDWSTGHDFNSRHCPSAALVWGGCCTGQLLVLSHCCNSAQGILERTFHYTPIWLQQGIPTHNIDAFLEWQNPLKKKNIEKREEKKSFKSKEIISDPCWIQTQVFLLDIPSNGLPARSNATGMCAWLKPLGEE